MSNDNIYLDIKINNNSKILNNLNLSVLAQYDETKTTPIVKKLSDYKLSVVSASFPLGSNIPLWILYPEPNQANPNLMQASFSITNGAFTSTQNVIYVSPNNFTPPIQNQLFPIVTEYYFGYSYEYLAGLFNNTLNNCYIAAGSPGGSGPPYIRYDIPTNRYLFIVHDDFISAGGRIYFNSVTYQYLNGLAVIYLAGQPNLTLELILYRSWNNCNQYGYNIGESAYVGGNNYWSYMAEYNATQKFYPLSKIVVTSSSIPVAQQANSLNLTVGFQNSVIVYESVILDFDIDFTASQNQGQHVYTKSSDDLDIDLSGDVALYRLQIKVNWLDNTGKIWDYYLSTYDSINLKIQFKKKIKN